MREVQLRRTQPGVELEHAPEGGDGAFVLAGQRESVGEMKLNGDRGGFLAGRFFQQRDGFGSAAILQQPQGLGRGRGRSLRPEPCQKQEDAAHAFIVAAGPWRNDNRPLAPAGPSGRGRRASMAVPAAGLHWK